MNQTEFIKFLGGKLPFEKFIPTIKLHANDENMPFPTAKKLLETESFVEGQNKLGEDEMSRIMTQVIISFAKQFKNDGLGQVSSVLTALGVLDKNHLFTIEKLYTIYFDVMWELYQSSNEYRKLFVGA